MDNKVVYNIPTLDNWQNEITGLGVFGKDKRMSAFAVATVRLGQTQLDNIYDGDFLAEKVVLLPSKDMTREGIIITPDESLDADKIDKINKDLKTLKMWKYIRKALQWSILYGGGVVVMIIEDGMDSEEPVNINNIKTIRGLYDLNRFQILPVETQNDPRLPGFLEPIIFQLQSLTTATPGTKIAEDIVIGTKFHRSRLMLFDGIDLPEHLRVSNQGWGNSVLQVIQNELRNYHTEQDSAATIVTDFSQAVFKIKDLHSKVAAGSGSVVAKRMAIMNLARSLINAVVISTDGEEFERKSTNVTGLEGLMKQAERAVVAATGIPHTILFGDSPSGLGATGESEDKTWKDHVKGLQEDKIRPELNMLLEYYSASNDSGLNGLEINYVFASLWQMTDKEKADIRKTISETDRNNIQMSVYSPNEARTRYEGDEFSLDIALDETNRMEFENVIEEPEEIEDE